MSAGRRARRAIVLGGLLLGSISSSPRARGDEPAAPLSPPPLALSLTPPAAGAGGGPWKLRVENTGDVPVRIAADPRLLVLEVTPPAGFVDPTAKKGAATGAKKAELAEKPARCVLPDDARPTTDEGRDLVIPAKRSWSQTIDPFFYCFGPRERAVLVAGATVKARFGWPAPPLKPGARAPKQPAAPTAPFVAAPMGAALGKVAPAKELEAAPFTLAESAAPPQPASAAGSPTGSGSGSLVLSMAETQDVARGTEISATVTVANDGDAAAILLLRPETLRFAVAGAAGSVACGTPRRVESPIRELYSTLGVKGRAPVTVLLTAKCPADTFDEPGIYRVTPVLDTTGASGRPIGLKTWDSMATGATPMLLRVRSQRRPFAPTARPALD